MAKTKKKPAASAKMCDCVKLVGEALKETNTELAIEFRINFETRKTSIWPTIATRKRDSKNREAAKKLFPTFCPFCGKKYPKEAGR